MNLQAVTTAVVKQVAQLKQKQAQLERAEGLDSAACPPDPVEQNRSGVGKPTWFQGFALGCSLLY